MGKLLIYVIVKMSKIQTEFDHDNKDSANTSPELISIDHLDYV